MFKFILFYKKYCLDACQSPGNAPCYSAEYDLEIGDPCCPGTQCLLWLGEFDYFCQFTEHIQEGQFCGVSWTIIKLEYEKSNFRTELVSVLKVSTVLQIIVENKPILKKNNKRQ